MSKSVISSVVGALLITVISVSKADDYPGDAGFQAICQEIIDDVTADSIPFRRLGAGGVLIIHETPTKYALCQRLTTRHNSKNAAYLGGSMVNIPECVGAFAAPVTYGLAEWNNWAGLHCGAWRNVDEYCVVTQTFTDHARWNNAVTTTSGFYRQEVNFLSRTDPCCLNGWNEAGGTVSQPQNNYFS